MVLALPSQLGVDVASRIPGYVLSAIILVWYVVQVLRDILVVYGKGLQEVSTQVEYRGSVIQDPAYTYLCVCVAVSKISVAHSPNTSQWV